MGQLKTLPVSVLGHPFGNCKWGRKEKDSMRAVHQPPLEGSLPKVLSLILKLMLIIECRSGGVSCPGSEALACKGKMRRCFSK